MARKKEEVGVSFFAFQDIITAVTGIMFLVVLLIILLLFEKRIVDTVEQVDTKKVEEAQQKIESLTQEIQSLESFATSTTTFSNMTSIEIAEQLNLHQQMIELLNQSIEKIKQEKKLKEEILKTQEETIKHIVDKAQTCKEEIKNTQKRIKQSKIEYESLKKEVEKKKNQISISVIGETNKKPILVECNEKCLRVKMHSGGKTIEYPCKDVFLKSCASIDRNRFYFILLIKPDAFEYAGKLQIELKKMGFERGIEVLPSNETEVF